MCKEYGFATDWMRNEISTLDYKDWIKKLTIMIDEIFS